MNIGRSPQADDTEVVHPIGLTLELPDGWEERHPLENDHPRVQDALRDWWPGFGGEAGAQQRALLLPRLYFQHFNNTSYVVEDEAGQLEGFLVGLQSQSEPDVGYIHFVGVNPTARRAGLGRHLYGRFFEAAADRGVSEVRCITSPGNANSIAFHTAMGFEVESGDKQLDGVTVHADYDGPGLDRVVFSRPLTNTDPSM